MKLTANAMRLNFSKDKNYRTNAMPRCEIMTGFTDSGMRGCLTNSENITCGVKKNSGFTLVEILTVVGIVLLLILLLVPSLTNALESSYLATCANNLKQFSNMAHMYSEDNNGYICTITCYKQLAPYGVEALLKQSGESESWFTCPRQYSRYSGFEQHFWIGAQSYKHYTNRTNKLNRYIKMQQLPKPAQMVFEAPSITSTLFYLAFGTRANQPTPHFSGCWVPCGYGDMDARGGVGQYGEENLLFFDGHAKAYWWDDPEIKILANEWNPNTW